MLLAVRADAERVLDLWSRRGERQRGKAAAMTRRKEATDGSKELGLLLGVLAASVQDQEDLWDCACQFQRSLDDAEDESGDDVGSGTRRRKGRSRRRRTLVMLGASDVV